MPSECQCHTCQSACTTRPGWFLPGEIEKVARFLEISPQDLFDKYLVADNTFDDFWILAPAQLHAEPGHEAPFEPRGTCIFLKNGKCEIHEVKPYECREYLHSDDRDVVRLRHRSMGLRWAKHQDQITQLLGRPPNQDNLTGND